MSYGLAMTRYISDAAETASPERLLVMLYDRLSTDLRVAAAAMEAGDHALTGKRLGNAIAIVLELQASLKVDLWDGAPQLNEIYGWLVTELMTASGCGDVMKVKDCSRVVEPLRDAWHEAYALVCSDQQTSTVPVG